MPFEIDFQADAMGTRLAAVARLIRFGRGWRTALAELATHPWTYSGRAVVLRRSDIESVLQRLLEGEVSPAEVAAWCEALETRQDIEREDEHADWIGDVLVQVSMPLANGPLTREWASELLGAR